MWLFVGLLWAVVGFASGWVWVMILSPLVSGVSGLFVSAMLECSLARLVCSWVIALPVVRDSFLLFCTSCDFVVVGFSLG